MKIRVPSDIEVADRIFAGLTFRQLIILSVDALVLWALYGLLGAALPLWAFGLLAAPVAAGGLAVAMAKVEGHHLEQMAASALRYLRAPKKRVMTREGSVRLPEWARTGAEEEIAPLRLPVEGVDAAGYLDLGTRGVVAICRASSINFGLRSEPERQALVEGFGRLLNALEGPAQFLVRSERTDLREEIAALEERAVGLAHPALEKAARDHAAFLRSLANSRDVLRREILFCLWEPGSPASHAPARLGCQIEEMEGLLRGMGIRLSRLCGEEAANLLDRKSVG
jgi:hypothetical protein